MQYYSGMFILMFLIIMQIYEIPQIVNIKCMENEYFRNEVQEI